MIEIIDYSLNWRLSWWNQGMLLEKLILELTLVLELILLKTLVDEQQLAAPMVACFFGTLQLNMLFFL